MLSDNCVLSIKVLFLKIIDRIKDKSSLNRRRYIVGFSQLAYKF